jgi:hypothetical protein
MVCIYPGEDGQTPRHNSFFGDGSLGRLRLGSRRRLKRFGRIDHDGCTHVIELGPDANGVIIGATGQVPTIGAPGNTGRLIGVLIAQLL